LGQYYFDEGSLVESAGYYRKALTLRPLAPQVWFRLGAISMQIGDWATALEAFSNVVQQEPEEYDAWANVAAVHMKNKCPEEAYPALKESLKYSRTNWRIWTSQLYTCIDLSKYDEAIQACTALLDLQQTQSQVPNLEEKCIKAIVGKTLALDRKDDSTKRTLSRLHTLLDRLSSKASAEAWIWETLAYFHEQVGWDEHVLQNLLKEYRALQAVPAWERDDHQVTKVVAVVCQISHFYVAKYKRQSSDGNGGAKDALIKCRYQVKGVLQKIKAVHSMDESKMPLEEIERLEGVLVEVQELMQNHSIAS
jgi:tetratricopeptide (TPR) repeat protein